jgi:glucose-6-phosphate isomerase
MKDLFAQDADRFSKFSMCVKDIVFDYSKNILTQKTIDALLQLATECKLKEAIAAMYNGEKINVNEDRAVLHTALRNFSGKPIFANGQDVMPGIKAVLKQMDVFCNDIHTGIHKGYTNKKIKYA